ncbi:MAG: chemotaxis-specific protein-glutamate methyltransferase CheB [bacterium]|nr:chemotaxis-specific protein-glutamate methyltransferase CheB [bacterium]
MIKVLICDDSAFMRVTLKGILESDPGIEVIGTARNGEKAVQKAGQSKPDVVTMDIHMPVMDGIAALKEIVKQKIAPVIMISSLAIKDAPVTVTAMEAGAFDFITKPNEMGGVLMYSEDIIRKVKEAASSNIYSKIDKPGKTKTLLPPRKPKPTHTPPRRPLSKSSRSGIGFKAVVLGLSTGGPKTIYNVLPKLPPDLNAAVIIVQHMPPAFLTTYAQHIDTKTQMGCLESDAGMQLEPGKIYVAKGASHLRLSKKSAGEVIIQQAKEPKHLFMPSVDIVMDAVLEVFGADTIGVLMTGMGRDGAKAMVNVVKAGGKTIAESKETAIVFGMPYEAIKLGGAQVVVPNHLIAAEIVKAVG